MVRTENKMIKIQIKNKVNRDDNGNVEYSSF